MIIEPKVRGFICTTAHPTGCYQNILNQINFIKSQGKQDLNFKKVLIVGGSSGYGLASRIASTYLMDAETINICFEKAPRENKTASAGWYNTYAFEKIVESDYPNSLHRTINNDAFSDETKKETCELIKEKWGKLDLLIYSLASPIRKDPITGKIYKSVIKPIKQTLTSKAIDLSNDSIIETTIEPATPEEIKNTEKVMGGEDWQIWINKLKEQGLLNENFHTMAFSYIGPKLTQHIYREGTIGKAKIHLEKSCSTINREVSPLNGKALISINKALVTQAASAIPILPLYISILYKIMKKKSLHESCIEQINRLFQEKIKKNQIKNNTISLDDHEMRKEVQEEVIKTWNAVTTANLNKITDLESYKKEFLNLFGFGIKGIDYQEDIDSYLMIKNLKMVKST